MEQKEEPRIVDTISCHAWNATRTKLAICPGDHRVHVYAIKNQDPNQRTLESTLDEHDSFISAIDWSVNNDIVTCSHDRNAYVWKCAADGTWKPTLVILRINRAATAVKWSPDGLKFAVASGAKCVPVCHYEPGNDWWISKMIKSHKSTVLCLDWSPNSKLLITGSSDKRCRIFSAFISEIDSTDDAEVFAGIFPNQHAFGDVLHEFEFNHAWINCVSWSPGYFRVAFASHNSTITFAQLLSGGSPSVCTVRQSGLPYASVAFLSDNTVVATGWDNNPHIYVASGSPTEPVWKLTDKLDKKPKPKDGGAASSGSAVSAARAMFAGAASRGIAIKDNAGSSGAPEKLETRHQNTITGIFLLPKDGEESVKKFSTCGADGRVLMWNIPDIVDDLGALKLA